MVVGERTQSNGITERGPDAELPKLTGPESERFVRTETRGVAWSLAPASFGQKTLRVTACACVYRCFPYRSIGNRRLPPIFTDTGERR